MERAGRLLAQRLRRCVDDHQLGWAAWRAAVGERVARHTLRVQLVQGRLVVEVEDEIWRQQLLTLRRQILANLHQVVGPSVIGELEIHAGTRRKAPASAGMESLSRSARPVARASTAVPTSGWRDQH